MNNNLIFVQNLETDAKVSFDGLYDIDDNPVTVMIERNGNSFITAIFKDYEDDEYEDDDYDDEEDFEEFDDDYDDIDSCGICEDCLREECSKHDDCDDCPISHCCERMFEDDE